MPRTTWRCYFLTLLQLGLDLEKVDQLQRDGIHAYSEVPDAFRVRGIVPTIQTKHHDFQFKGMSHILYAKAMAEYWQIL